MRFLLLLLLAFGRFFSLAEVILCDLLRLVATVEGMMVEGEEAVVLLAVVLLDPLVPRRPVHLCLLVLAHLVHLARHRLLVHYRKDLFLL